jgi:hypothetical protein
MWRVRFSNMRNIQSLLNAPNQVLNQSDGLASPLNRIGKYRYWEPHFNFHGGTVTASRGAGSVSLGTHYNRDSTEHAFEDHTPNTEVFD